MNAGFRLLTVCSVRLAKSAARVTLNTSQGGYLTFMLVDLNEIGSNCDNITVTKVLELQ